ncbi:hypothetical protein [Anaerocellum danielii]|uniref:TraC-like domain-containing protein n=1 Tax=Anaerocellum danielii TaxID=1387557 RepID=A0ABZ0U1Z7_9FIRM|nr:hypothetical protein [Caldicellulosiruptor danielii]WPX08220.1 hypothetical protein SOJ16_002087 [Caldicellulosiruptor danielii]
MSSDLLILVVGGVVLVVSWYISKSGLLNFAKTGTKKSTANTQGQGKQSVNNSKNQLKKLLGIKEILPDGTVVMDDYRYARIFYLSSQDIDLMSEAEEEALELNLIAAMRALDCPVQFFTTTQRVDTAQQVKEIEQFLKNPAVIMSDTLRQYCQSLKSELEDLQRQKELLVRKSYMVIWVREPNEKVAFEKLNQRVKNAVALLKKADFKIYQLSMPEALQLLGDELNKNQVFKVEEAIKKGALDLVITSQRGIAINDEVIQEVNNENPAK